MYDSEEELYHIRKIKVLHVGKARFNFNEDLSDAKNWQSIREQ